MAGFDGQDAACGGEVALVRDLLCCAEVGRGADSFENARGSNECFDTCNAEGVFALRDGLGSSSLETCSKELHVRSFVGADGLNVFVKGLVVASSLELGFREVGEAFAVELVFKMLKSQRILQDIGCRECQLSSRTPGFSISTIIHLRQHLPLRLKSEPLERRSNDQICCCEHDKDCIGLHDEVVSRYRDCSRNE